MTRNPERRLTVRLCTEEIMAVKQYSDMQNKSVNTTMREVNQLMKAQMEREKQIEEDLKIINGEGSVPHDNNEW